MLFDFLLFDIMDQRNCIKFCIKNEIKCSKTIVYVESTMSRPQVQLWYNRFKKDREDVNDDARPDRRIPIRDVADDVGISFGSCQAMV